MLDVKFKRYVGALRRTAIAVAVSAFAAGPAVSAQRFDWTVTDAPAYGYILGALVFPDQDRGAKDIGYGGQLGFGVPVLDWMSVEANLFQGALESDGSGDNFSQTGWGVDFVANFGDREKPTPYVLFGGGQIKNDADFDDTSAYLNLGGGIVGKLNTRWLRYRAEARLVNDRYLDDQLDVRLGLGLEVVLGSFREPPPPPPQVIETVKIVEAPPQPPLDSDGDGVADAFDRCPNTIRGAQVDGFGCVVKPQTIELQNVTFQFNSAALTENAKAVLEPAVRFLTSQPSVRAEIAGHTDSRGSDAYNKKLSLQRADAVRAYLVSRGVSPAQLTAVGYGESRPIDSNDTEEGRTRNRRVELQIRGSSAP
ncbi:OmpA family protein [Fontimonas sp. SYSU GA230001]|uniref:OmpA family protein n=1 Tax=Fontimonas sp. SYSU GA230001 TaxID=3142450 RepID=UPI0032B43A85